METRLSIPQFDSKKELITWLISNKSVLIAQKKSAVKYADAISYSQELFFTDKQGTEFKVGDVGVGGDVKKIKVRSIINTTNLFDSHQDVHIDQLWNKSLKETKGLYLVNQHNFTFEGIISDNVKAFAKQMTWHELGLNMEGTTQALVFDSVIDKAESPDMFNRYSQGKVKNHSVGMQYVKVDLAVNDDRYEKEFKVWEKYFDRIANKEDVLENGFFWAVTEAKVIEGSAVVRGSNYATPTQSVEPKNEPVEATQPGAVDNTPKVDVVRLVKEFYQPKI